ncbi:MAG: hypothetical protein KC443_07785 [Anaerolineales bacterium]|nr:hypothetical protein [Anaerolineales bacterium]
MNETPTPPASSHTARRSPLTLFTLWSALLTFGVYGRTLSFPFFSDDFFQMPFLDAHSLGALWRTAEGLFFFRPLAFTLWKLLYFGVGYDTAVFHLVNLLLHWLNGILVAWLTARLWAADGRKQWRRGFVAGTLFLLFPFSYEGVAWVAAVMHPQFLALILCAIIGYLQAFYPQQATPTQRQRLAWGGFSLLCVLLAPFAHENGVLVAPLLLVVELVQVGDKRPLWPRLVRAGVWAGPLVAWLLLWRQVPAADGAGSLALNDWHTLGRNALYFVQGGAYPFTWLGGWLRDRFALDGFLVTILLALPALALLVWGQWRVGWSRRAALPWLWTAVSVSLAVLFLPWLHVSAAPRMLMLASVGIAWLWSDLLWAIAAHVRWRQALAGLLLAALLLQNGLFVLEQLDLYAIGGSAIRGAAAAALSAHERGETAVFINFPAWIAPEHATYALGQEGDILVLGAELLPAVVWAHSGQWVQVTAARVDAIRQQPPYYTGPLGSGPAWDVQNPTAIFRAAYFADMIQLQPLGRLGITPPTGPALATFADGLRLMAGTAVISEQGLQVDLTWQLDAAFSPDVTVFVHVLDAAGQLMAQADGEPLAGTYPFAAWPASTTLQDQRVVPEAAQAAAVRVGLYNRVTGERVTAVAADGTAFADSAVPIEITR